MPFPGWPGRGCPSPGALLITAEAYRHFILRTGIGESIALEINRKIVDQMRWEELWDAALRIRNLFLRTPLPDEIREDLPAKSSRASAAYPSSCAPRLPARIRQRPLSPGFTSPL